MKFLAAVLLTSILSFATHATTQDVRNHCSASFAAAESWRSTFTQLSDDQVRSVTPTNGSREREIERSVDSITDDVVNQWQTPVMEFFFSHGTRHETIRETGGYQTGTITRYRLKSRDGVLRGSLLLPTSGHTGNADDITRWSTTDTYVINIVDGSGNSSSLTGTRRSLAVVTVQEVEVQLTRGVVYQLRYERSGSGGSGGYPEGRIIEFIWQ